jgi:putative MATE family efflux protein
VGASADTLPYARDYLSVILSGVFLQTASMCLNSLVMAEGNARTVMIGQAIGAISNIILDAIFIIALHMGVKGAALGTIIAQLLATAYFLRFYLSGKSYLKFKIRNFLFQWPVIKEIMSIGVASLCSTLVSSLSMVIINRMLVLYSGDYAISAYGIVNRLVMFVLMPGIAIGQALQPILGYNYGMKNYARALRSIKIAVLYSTIVSLVALVILFAFPAVFVGIFTSDDRLIDLAVRSIYYIFSTLPMGCFIMVGSTIFQAVGKARQAFITSMARSCLFLFPAALLLPRLFHLEGVWLAFPVTDFLSAIMIVIFLIPLIREFKKEGKGNLSALKLDMKTD